MTKLTAWGLKCKLTKKLMPMAFNEKPSWARSGYYIVRVEIKQKRGK